MTDKGPQLPIAISCVGRKYLLFDIEAVTWIRRVHRICGVMSGTLPQAPSQNIFLGLPVQIMPEEAQLLVEREVAYIVDDSQAHDRAMQDGDTSRQSMYVNQLRKKGISVSIARTEEQEEIKRQKLKQVKEKLKAGSNAKKQAGELEPETPASPTRKEDDPEDSLFDSTSTLRPKGSMTSDSIIPHNIVPTTSNLWLPTPPSTPSRAESQVLLPNVPPSYALYKHLNDKLYYMTPGLRFGCQYSVYPGDPLRFHSHFLAVGFEWDEEIDLMHVVGGGRLGTGVKKGFLIGGVEPAGSEDGGKEESTKERVRTFSIEWAAM